MDDFFQTVADICRPLDSIEIPLVRTAEEAEAYAESESLHLSPADVGEATQETVTHTLAELINRANRCADPARKRKYERWIGKIVSQRCRDYVFKQLYDKEIGE